MLARRHRVVTIDGRGTGRSDRPDRSRPPTTTRSRSRTPLAVLDAVGADAAVVAGRVLRRALAACVRGRRTPTASLGAVLDRARRSSCRAAVAERTEYAFDGDAHRPRGLGALQRARRGGRDYERFVEFFWVRSAPSRTRPSCIEDGIGWARRHRRRGADRHRATPMASDTEAAVAAILGRIACPTLVHPRHRRPISPVERGERAAELTGGDLLLIEGGGHVPAGPGPDPGQPGAPRVHRSGDARRSSGRRGVPLDPGARRRPEAGAVPVARRSGSATPAATWPSPASCASPAEACRSTGSTQHPVTAFLEARRRGGAPGGRGSS